MSKLHHALSSWVVVGPQGLAYIGLHDSEDSAWQVFLGWPDPEEIEFWKREGWYAAPATANWQKPQPNTGVER
jgi:hypothetical protein